MKITYIKLENIAGIYVGTNKRSIEISFDNSENSIIAIIGENGKGKALPLSTKLPTPNGFKLMQDIQIGDMLFNEYGNVTRVTGVYPQGIKPVYQINFQYDRTAKCCNEHLWEYYTMNAKKELIHHIDTLENIRKTYCTKNGSFKQNVYIKNNGAVLYDYQEISEELWQLTLFNIKYKKGSIPDIFKYNDINTRQKIISKVLDGQVVYRNKFKEHHIIYTSNNIKLLVDLQEILWSLGYNASIEKDIYSIGSLHIIDQVQNIHKDRNNQYIQMKSIEKLNYEENMQCITVDNPTKLFLTENFVVTHNTVLLSSLTPFAYVGSLDERSTLPYIIKGSDGYKEIRYQHGDDQYIIKHYYKATKDSHSVKSYFMKNGQELNENGNTKSFLQLVELHFGLTEDMMRLMRIGSNVDSFISLTPAKRKEYIGKLIEEIDLYLKVYKKITDDIKISKAMLSNNSTSLYSCHINDPILEREVLNQMQKDITKLEKQRDEIISNISRLQTLISSNNIDELRRKQRDAEITIDDFNKLEKSIINQQLQDYTVDMLMDKRNNISDERINLKSKINSYRLNIDNIYNNITRLEGLIKKVTANNDMQSLISAIEDVKHKIDTTPAIIKSFSYNQALKSDTLQIVISKLTSYNQLVQMLYSFGNKPMNLYLKLIDNKTPVDKFIADQMKNNLNKVSDNNIKLLLDKLFINDQIITPLCEAPEECPYYRLANMAIDIRNKFNEESYDDETLRYLKMITVNIDNILNGLDDIKILQLPDKLIHALDEKNIIDKLHDHIVPFNIYEFQEYTSMVREREVYDGNVNKLKQYNSQLLVYKNSGIESHIAEINEQKKSIEFYTNNIETLSKLLNEVQKQMDVIDKQISLVSQYRDGKKYKKLAESTLESTTKTLIPLESAETEYREAEYNLRRITDDIKFKRSQYREKENKLNEYNRLIEEGKILSKQNNDLSIIQEAVSTKRGIPVVFMNQYLGRIQKLANDLLNLIYDGSLKIAKFKVSQETFEVPYIKNGMKIPDVKYGSQSEVSLITMALSFALANRASSVYNILLIDEIDSGLDESNRMAFLKMLYMQMHTLKSEQVFIISHNLSQMVNLPMDCIKLSDVPLYSKLQRVIYE